MALTNEDGVMAGYQRIIHFYRGPFTASAIGCPHAVGFSGAGIPAGFTPGSPGVSGAVIDGTTSVLGGTLPFTNPGSSSINSYLARCSLYSANGASYASFFDTLWYNSGLAITTTTAQTLTPVALPARDSNGTTNGVGVIPWLYCSTATTNAGAITNTTISYTNSAGTSGRTGTLSQSWPINAVKGTFIPFTLAAGDVGVASVQSVTLGTSYVSGAVNLMMIRELAILPLPSSPGGLIYDWAQLGIPQLYNGTALSYWLLPSATSVFLSYGDILVTQG